MKALLSGVWRPYTQNQWMLENSLGVGRAESKGACVALLGGREGAGEVLCIIKGPFSIEESPVDGASVKRRLADLFFKSASRGCGNARGL